MVSSEGGWPKTAGLIISIVIVALLIRTGSMTGWMIYFGAVIAGVAILAVITLFDRFLRRGSPSASMSRCRSRLTISRASVFNARFTAAVKDDLRRDRGHDARRPRRSARISCFACSSSSESCSSVVPLSRNLW